MSQGVPDIDEAGAVQDTELTADEHTDVAAQGADSTAGEAAPDSAPAAEADQDAVPSEPVEDATED